MNVPVIEVDCSRRSRDDEILFLYLPQVEEGDQQEKTCSGFTRHPGHPSQRTIFKVKCHSKFVLT